MQSPSLPRSEVQLNPSDEVYEYADYTLDSYVAPAGGAMPVNPFSRQCSVAGCGKPVTTTGRCADHARQQDQHRGLTADRRFKVLYDSKRWKRLRIEILIERLWCECEDCKGTQVL